MATASGYPGNIGDIVQCSVCLETYKDPRLYPACGHTFCLQCLEDSFRSRSSELPGELYSPDVRIQTDPAAANFYRVTVLTHLVCPLCRATLAIPAGGFYALPRNFVAQQLVEVRGDDGRRQLFALTADHAFSALQEEQKRVKEKVTEYKIYFAGEFKKLAEQKEDRDKKIRQLKKETQRVAKESKQVAKEKRFIEEKRHLDEQQNGIAEQRRIIAAEWISLEEWDQHVTKEKQRFDEEMQKICFEKQCLAEEKATVANEKQSLDEEKQRVARESKCVAEKIQHAKLLLNFAIFCFVVGILAVLAFSQTSSVISVCAAFLESMTLLLPLTIINLIIDCLYIFILFLLTVSFLLLTLHIYVSCWVGSLKQPLDEKKPWIARDCRQEVSKPKINLLEEQKKAKKSGQKIIKTLRNNGFGLD